MSLNPTNKIGSISKKKKGSPLKTITINFHPTKHTLLREFISLVALTSILLLFPLGTYGAEVSLAWDANSEPDLAGYIIYYGDASGDYSNSLDVGDITEFTVTGLDDGGTYYFAATAYDLDGNESAYSEELVHTFGYGQQEPPPPTQLMIISYRMPRFF